MIADARQKVAGDRRKVAHWRTERASLLLQVGDLDKKVVLWGGGCATGSQSGGGALKSSSNISMSLSTKLPTSLGYGTE